jgi:hypothetical protein
VIVVNIIGKRRAKPTHFRRHRERSPRRFPLLSPSPRRP